MTCSRGGVLLLVLMSAGCPGRQGGNAPAGGGTAAGGAGGAGPGATGAQTGGADVLWGASVDLDGDGREEMVALTSTEVKSAAGQRDEDPRINVPITECVPVGETCKVLLTIGSASQEIGVNAGYFGGLGAKIIDLDGGDKRREILISRFGASEEDPWLEFSIVIYDGSRIHYQEFWHSSGYNSGEATVGGKGTITLHYDECPDSFTVDYRLDGTRLVEAGRKTTRTRNPDECAACPYVYLLDAGEFRRQGEILRNLNRAALAGEQSLRLAATAGAGGMITIELREEKDEVTFLDEVHLDAGGTPVAPEECAAGGDFCAVDGAHHVLRRGDSLRLTFLVGEQPGPFRLFASGYYLSAPGAQRAVEP